MAAPTSGRRRADAERNIARIVAAARAELSSDPNATVDDIARAAGVGRMTLYGHFRTRPELVEAALTEALEAGAAVLSAVDLAGDARAAMERLLTSSWALVAESSALLVAAEAVLPAERIRRLHDAPAARMADLVRRGQEQGVFRTDMSAAWLVDVAHFILHGAAGQVRTGRLDADDAAGLVTRSIQSVLAG
ncbi:TetR/AcrR family transcriptional regulator [Actinomadura logoneensis]|uniref:TetR/AcrR family transcriptional regulator n=1 Tax=Actinomadura logoneensis TaxID=2293572 RepID=A0A372JLN1_9ACTN|nr:TetR/AcrR family transcriptional regulator [Actinomadura logoneensis]RFU40921.1 TetR/AcrR family transcriptional regulator [Actinomadura logoneensis]